MEAEGANEAEAASEADYWVKRVKSIGRFKVKDNDKRAPYKPLLLLWLIGRVAGGIAGPSGVQGSRGGTAAVAVQASCGQFKA